MSRWKVTQTDAWGTLIHSKTYRWKWQARAVAWVMSGNEVGGGRTFKTVIHEVKP